MGDLSARSTHTPSRPRPLGQVKTESLHFHTGSSHPSPHLPVYPELRQLYGDEDAFRLSVRSMRELRESLRHAALLNIVAAANTDQTQAEGAASGDDRPVRPPGATAPQHLQTPSHPRGSPASPLALQVTSSRSSPFPGEGAAVGRTAGSGNHHTVQGGGSTPHSLVANLLSPRMRTISIPRPRAHDLPGPFIHKSVTQAKENLSRVGELARARTEVEEGAARSGAVSTALTEPVSNQHGGAGPWKPPVAASGAGLVLPLRGHSLDPKQNQHNGHHDRAKDATSAKASSAQSRDTSFTFLSASTPTSNNPHSASMASERSSATTTDTSTGSKKASSKGKDDPRGTPAQQMLSVRRHLTPSKKRELVKRLTEIAKCEAVDMTDPVAAGEDDGELRFVSPMIIMSQQRQEIRHPEDSHVASTNKDAEGMTSDGTALRPTSRLHRAKSLNSLNGPNGFQHHTPLTRGKKTSSVVNESRTLNRAPSGSMPDLLAQEADEYGTDLECEEPETVEWTSESLFTDGIIGRTIRRDADVLGMPLESRPLLPATPSIKTRRGTRPTGRRSSLGLRDRGPSETPVPGASAAGARGATTNGTSDSAPAGTPPEGSVSYRPILPTLTITGLSAHNKPLHGAGPVNSRASREMRPTSQLSMSSNQKLFQQLDDQCEKLQRQLNISLNGPRRGGHWQHGTTSTALPISRSDVTAHLQCVPLTEGGAPNTGRAGVRDSPTGQGRRSQNLLAHGAPTALSNVEEHSIAGGAYGAEHLSERGGNEEREGFEREPKEWTQQPNQPSHFAQDQNPGLNRKTSFSSKTSFADSLDGPSGLRVNLDCAADTDPVLQSGLKEPRYQGFSSRVGENEGKSQFHYVNSSRTESEEAAREMKYRVLKALDQDVYYDFQHRKYRNTNTATPVAKFNGEEERPRVHFYKVKVNGDS
ncbi:hypothetical protein BaRGS_00012831 [Batillaria attramentaria]|uniref:Uncharacterized protein n=1 Tax=Batillaria attramentaria TaxID=370345 RepID=A0ABD0L953_9CAEN